MQKSYWWVADESEVWIKALQTGPEAHNGLIPFFVEESNMTLQRPETQCYQIISNKSDDETGNIDDLVFLAEVNPASILHATRIRFYKNSIYSSCGTVLMSVNPFEKIPGLCGIDVIDKYLNSKEKLTSHIYQIPANAYRELSETGENQSILISGESGAGKTECAKECLNYLIRASHMHFGNMFGGDKTKIEKIGRKIIDASPILEAFGNASTSRNYNSSRFGKWTELQFTSSNVLYGSTIISYLLEKSRITSQLQHERNYHIFYQILLGYENLESLNISTNMAFRYISSNLVHDRINDVENFKSTKLAFKSLGFNDIEVENIFKVVLGILMIGNIDFNNDGDESCSVSKVNSSLKIVANLLSINESLLEKAICSRSIQSGAKSNIVSISLSAAKATSGRDTLSRSLYDKLFGYITDSINKYSNDLALYEENKETSKYIGLLDIYGFEILERNSFEQICINYCNEILQQYFNFVIFISEKKLYDDEGIVCDTIQFQDNISVIKDIETICKNLDDEGRLPKGSSKNWYEKATKTLKTPNISFLQRKSMFMINHYAGKVEYTIDDLMEKNLESVNNELLLVMFTSSDKIIQSLFQSDCLSTTNNSTSKSTSLAKSISKTFLLQLIELRKKLETTGSHFIRCIKSNNQSLPNSFDNKLVNSQLVYSGIFEVVKIQQSGLPCRYTHQAFLNRYKCLCPSNIRYHVSVHECLKYLKSSKEYKEFLSIDNLQIGLTKVFCKSNEQNSLEMIRDQILFRATMIIQSIMRCIHRKYFHPLMKSIKDLNDCIKFKNLEAAEESYKIILSYISKYSILVPKLPTLFDHIKKRVFIILETLKMQMSYIKKISALRESLTYENIFLIEELLPQAKEYGFDADEDVLFLNGYVKRFNNAKKVILDLTDFSQVKGRSSTSLRMDLADLEEFREVLPNSQKVMTRVEGYIKQIEEEIASYYQPLLELFESNRLKYDSIGELVLVNQDCNPNDLLMILQSNMYDKEFFCQETIELLEDCKIFVYIKDNYVLKCDYQGTLNIINQVFPRTSILKDQLKVFKAWASFDVLIKLFTEAFTKGGITRYCSSKSIPLHFNDPKDVIQINKLHEVLALVSSKYEQFGAMSNARIKKTVTVASNLLKLREICLKENWEDLLVFYPLIQQELSNIQDYQEFPFYEIELKNCEYHCHRYNHTQILLCLLMQEVISHLVIGNLDFRVLQEDMNDTKSFREDVLDFLQIYSNEAIDLQQLTMISTYMNDLKKLILLKNYSNGFELLMRFNKDYEDILISYNLLEIVMKELDCSKAIFAFFMYVNDLQKAILPPSEGYYVWDLEDQDPQSSNITYLCINHYVLRQSIEVLSLAMKQLEAVVVIDSNEISKDISDLLLVAQGILLIRSKVLEMSESNQLKSDVWDSIYDAIISLNSISSIPIEIKNELQDILADLELHKVVSFYHKVLSLSLVEGRIGVDLSINQIELENLRETYHKCSMTFHEKIPKKPKKAKALEEVASISLLIRHFFINGQYKEALNKAELLKSNSHFQRFLLQGIQSDINKIEAECHLLENVKTLKMELSALSCWDEDNVTSKVIAKLPYESLQHLLSSIDSEDYAPIYHDIALITKNLIHILSQISRGEVHLIDVNELKRIIDFSISMNINTSKMESILTFILFIQFIQLLCKLINIVPSPKTHFPTISSEKLSEEAIIDIIHKKDLMMIKKDIQNLFNSLGQWIQYDNTIDYYFQLSKEFINILDAIQQDNWLSIIDLAKQMEDQLEGFLDNNSEKFMETFDYGDIRYFLKLLEEIVLFSYQYAVKLKDKQIKKSPVSLETSESSRRRYLLAEDSKNPQGITQLRRRGLSDYEIVELNGSLPIESYWAARIEVGLLRKKGFSLQDLYKAGYSYEQLFQCGFSVNELQQLGCDAKTLYRAGATIEHLQYANYDPIDILLAGYDVSTLKSRGLNVSKLLLEAETPNLSSIDIVSLVNLGFTLKDLRKVGHSVNSLRLAGFKLDELIDAGFTCIELQLGGFSNEELIEKGFMIEEIVPLPTSMDDSHLSISFISSDLESELDVLMDIFRFTNGKKWKNKRNWGDRSKPLSSWFGVTMNKSGHVIKLILSQNNLYGALPLSIGKLKHLQVLDLRYNNLFSIIPSSICKLKNLTHLHLHCNAFSGPIPPKIGKCKKLIVLELKSNQLCGLLPQSLKDLTSLHCLALQSNTFDIIYGINDVKSLIPGCRLVKI